LLTVVLVVRDQGGYFPPSWGWSALALFGVVVTWLVASGRTDAQGHDAVFLAALLGLTAWVGLSIAWSVDPAQSVLELERSLVLLAGCAAFLVLARRGALSLLVPALLLGISGICAYALATRLAPAAGAFHPDNPVTGYRLFQPVGYWNGLGLFAALGVVLALGLATEPAVHGVVRVLASVSLVVVSATLFFTFSRGAWLALAFGLLVAFAASPRRLRLVAEGAVFAIPPAAAVLLAARATALTHESATFAAATHAGHRLALELILLGLASAALVPAVTLVERRLHPGAAARRAFAIALAAVALVVVAAGLVRGGGPVAVTTRAYDSFVDPAPPVEGSDVTGRLTSLNGNGRARMWTVAIDSLRGRWLTGSGAGGFQRNWEQSRKADEVVRDAHGLYVETLSELGIVGLALLVTVLAIPLVVGLRTRALPAIPAVAGAYATFLLHLAVDWDWELSGVALTGLLVGCVLLVAGRDGRERAVGLPLRVACAGAGVAAAAFAFVGLAGNTALTRAQAANRAHRYPAAASAAAVAHRWMPWSPAPLEELGSSQLERGDTAGARASFRAAISIDPHDWHAWLDLAASVQGRERQQAVARARSLYPTSPEIAEFEATIRSRSGG
jgi:hypothetical protein